MKFSCVILICPMVIALVMTSAQLTRTTFDECEPGEWIVTNTKIDWEGETKRIAIDITYSEDSKIYTVHIIIDGCNNRANCTGEPQVWIDNVDCNENLPDSKDMDACRVADEVGRLEKEMEYFTKRYGRWFGNELFNWAVCINIQNISLNITSPDESE
jgi:hypothetical protein